ncbi:hypothetical protein ACOME3_009588 [Neoechinorhynchus agilis]
MAKRNYDVLLKILLVGDSGVGKTCILQRFCCDDYNDSFISTIGIDFKVVTVQISGRIVKLQIWDTAGQERFHTITTSYYRGANAVVLIYDVTSAKSFHNITNWLSRIEKQAPPRIVKMMLGNKIDMNDKIEVAKENATELAENMHILFFETSARDGTNVSKAFYAIAEKALDQYLQHETVRSSQIGSGVDINKGTDYNGTAGCTNSPKFTDFGACGCL